MEITNELLAAYAEGNVTEPERNAVRQYLTDNPNELETMLMLMDEDYDLELDDNDSMDFTNDSLANDDGVFSNICYSAVAFAPRITPIKKIINSPPKPKKSNFNQRLGILLDELDL